jgi:hypothetical protein
MPLKITKASDPIEVKNIVVCIHGDPGIGKSSLGFTAEKPLCIAFDKGVYRAKNRKDLVRVETWTEVSQIRREDLAGYSTVLVDTGGRALDCLTAHLIYDDPKNARKDGALSIQGYGVLKTVFATWLNTLGSFGLDVVLLCHSNEEKKGDDMITRLDMQGSSKNEVYKSSDLMGSLYMEKGRRRLNFNPSDVSFGKNPGLLPVIDMPESPDMSLAPHLLADAIAKTKEGINRLTAEQAEAQALQTTWAERIATAATCTDFDALVKLATEEKAPKAIATMMAKAAKAKGFEWNKATKAYDLAAGAAGKDAAA